MKKIELHYYTAIKALSNYRESVLYEYEEIRVNDPLLKKEIEDIDCAMQWFKRKIRNTR